MSIYINQRTKVRNNCLRPIMFSRWGSQDCFKSRMFDYNKDGIGFISDFPYLPGTELAIKMGKQEEESYANVVWSKAEHRGTKDKPLYRVGVKFMDTI